MLDTPSLRSRTTLDQFRSLNRRHHEEIGYVTDAMLAKYAYTQRLHALWHEDMLLGYIIANDTTRHPARTKYPDQMRIYVACIDYRLHRRLYGTMLVNHVEQLALRTPARRIGLWCAEDIEANAFWTALGFTPGRTRDGGRKRGRKHIEYIRTLPAH